MLCLITVNHDYNDLRDNLEMMSKIIGKFKPFISAVFDYVEFCGACAHILCLNCYCMFVTLVCLTVTCLGQSTLEIRAHFKSLSFHSLVK